MSQETWMSTFSMEGEGGGGWFCPQAPVTVFMALYWERTCLIENGVVYYFKVSFGELEGFLLQYPLFYENPKFDKKKWIRFSMQVET